MAGDRRGFNLIETMLPVLALTGAAAGFFLGEGVLPVTLGFLIGMFSPLLLLIPFALFDRHEVGAPLCFNGTCGPEAYTWDVQPQGLCRCSCGDEYELVDDQTRFVRHFGGGLQLPYMKRDRRGRWQPELRQRQAS